MNPTQAAAAKAPITASQHANPRSDIEIAQAAKKRPIMDIAREKLGIAPENLEPYGHYKAKVSMDYIKSLKNRPNGASHRSGPASASRAAPPAAAMPKSCRWRTSIFISPATSTPSAPRIICFRR